MGEGSREIERKFLVTAPLSTILAQYPGHVPLTIEQRYLGDCGKWTTRIRKTSSDGFTDHHLTLKKKITNISCVEIETRISLTFYNQMTEQCGPALRKHRHRILHGNVCWEVDEFLNPELNGLIIAEIELQNEDDVIDIPNWIGEEVSEDRQYKNAKLVRRLNPSASA